MSFHGCASSVHGCGKIAQRPSYPITERIPVSCCIIKDYLEQGKAVKEIWAESKSGDWEANPSWSARNIVGLPEWSPGLFAFFAQILPNAFYPSLPAVWLYSRIQKRAVLATLRIRNVPAIEFYDHLAVTMPHYSCYPLRGFSGFAFELKTGAAGQQSHFWRPAALWGVHFSQTPR